MNASDQDHQAVQQRLWWLEQQEGARFWNKQTRAFVYGMVAVLVILKMIGIKSEILVWWMTL